MRALNYYNLLFCIQIAHEFRNLSECYRVVISDICNKMGLGMCEFAQRDVVTNKDWDLVRTNLASNKLWDFFCNSVRTCTISEVCNTMVIPSQSMQACSYLIIIILIIIITFIYSAHSIKICSCALHIIHKNKINYIILLLSWIENL